MPTEEVKPKKKRGKSLLIIIILLLIAGLCIGFLVRFKNIKPGYIGVKSSIGNPIDNTSDFEVVVVKGYVIYVPLYTDVKIYPTTVQTAAYDTMRFSTDDGVVFVIKPRVSYQLDEDKVVSFYKDYKENLKELNTSYIKELVANAYATAASGFDSDSLIQNMNTFESEAVKVLSNKMADAGLILKNVNPNLEIPENIKRLVEERNLAKHNMLLAQDKLHEEYAKANVQRVKDSLLNSALTSLAIQKMFIEKWDGRLSSEVESPKAYRDINETEAPEK